MSPHQNHELLERAVRRAARRPFFLSWDFAFYKDLHHLDDAALADLLGCSLESLMRLALCRKPSLAGAEFRQEVQQVAEYAGADPVQLAQLLREVDSLQALRERPDQVESEAGMLLAARDRLRDHLRDHLEEQPSPESPESPTADEATDETAETAEDGPS